MKPILFNTEMTRAILAGRKIITRRAVKPQPKGRLIPELPNSCWPGYFGEEGTPRVIQPPYFIGDILYVRETFFKDSAGKYHYKADDDLVFFAEDIGHGLGWQFVKWHPSIHMPKEAARLFLRVTAVRVERLQDITEEQALAEGMPDDLDYPISGVYCPVCKGYGLVGSYNPETLGFCERECSHCDTARKRFSNLWDTTIKPADLPLYGWHANPWVWVIEFERTRKED